jgi:hypothetical protein
MMLFEYVTAGAGLKCVRQELINWGDYFCIDCFSLITQAGGRWDKEYMRIRNRHFDVEIARAKSWSA